MADRLKQVVGEIATAEIALGRLKQIFDDTPAEHPDKGKRRAAWRAQADDLARLNAERDRLVK